MKTKKTKKPSKAERPIPLLHHEVDEVNKTSITTIVVPIAWLDTHPLGHLLAMAELHLGLATSLIQRAFPKPAAHKSSPTKQKTRRPVRTPRGQKQT